MDFPFRVVGHPELAYLTLVGPSQCASEAKLRPEKPAPEAAP
jgi:hypothetical protein